MKSKYAFNLIGLLALTIFFTISAFAQTTKSEVKNATWQTSVPEIVNAENPSLGIRDKWGSLETYNALFVVTAPNKKVFKARKQGTGDEFIYVDFPTDFNAKLTAKGVYTVVFYVNGVVIRRDKFKFQP